MNAGAKNCERLNQMTMSYKDFDNEEFVHNFEVAEAKVNTLKRCTRCILPETFPFIAFDDDGVCNYCHHYKKMKPLGMDALEQSLQPYKNTNEPIKCIVSFSGGRDSSYGLHFVKKVLGLDAVALTYDWGVAPELARRNQLKMCEKLGVEQIVIKANLEKKRENIKANLKAWLKKPNLGTIPVLTSGGQYFFYHANRMAKRIGRELIVLCATPLETTYFKTGFSGIAPQFDHRYSLSNKLKLAFNYLGNFIQNPAYINKSLLDTLGGYFSIYFIPRNQLRLFNYIRWDEDIVNNTLLNKYSWETSEETSSTWRIDDGTVPLTDYMYYMMSGLTINDTFRSNQIREGKLTRDEALRIVRRENQPRFNAIQWYCDIIKIDFESTLRTINHAHKLY